MKKIFFFLFILILFSAMPTQNSFAASIYSGDLIKASQPAVYYYGADGKRYVFPNEKTYRTWYSDFSTVKTITDVELAAIQIGGNVTYRPGIKMVKIQTDPKVYAVQKGGVLRWIKSELVATTVYGSNWSLRVEDVPDAFFTNYTVGLEINSDIDFNVESETNSVTAINDDKSLVSGGQTATPPEQETPAPAALSWIVNRITNSTYRQKSPNIVASNDNFGVAWTDNSNYQDEVKFGAFNEDGSLSGGPYVLSFNSYDSTMPSIAWNGSEYGAVWEDYLVNRREIYFGRIDKNGSRPIFEKAVTNKIGFAKNPEIVWSGSNYGIFWWDTRNTGGESAKGNLYFQKANQSGQFIGNNLRFTDDLSSIFKVNSIWGNSEFASVWADDRNGQSDIYFVRANDGGSILGSEKRLTETTEDSMNPSIVWDGSNYRVVWQERTSDSGAGHYEIYYQKLSSTGEKIGNIVKLTTKTSGDSESPKIVKNGDKFGIAWTDYRESQDKSNSEIYFMEIDADGKIITSEQNISNASGLSVESSIAVLNGKYAIVFADYRDGNYEIYSAKSQ